MSAVTQMHLFSWFNRSLEILHILCRDSGIRAVTLRVFQEKDSPASPNEKGETDINTWKTILIITWGHSSGNEWQLTWCHSSKSWFHIWSKGPLHNWWFKIILIYVSEHCPVHPLSDTSRFSALLSFFESSLMRLASPSEQKVWIVAGWGEVRAHNQSRGPDINILRTLLRTD